MKNNKKRAARVKQTRSLLARNPRKPTKAPTAAMALGGPRRPIENPSAGMQRVVDTVDLLYRRGQIDARQRQAADLYRDAWYGCQTGVPSSIDMDKVPGAGGASACSPTETQMRAAETLGQAAGVLGSMGSRVVVIVICWGESIDLATRRLYGASNDDGKARHRDLEFIGRMLRESLSALADLWVPYPKPKMRAVRQPDTAAPITPPARVKRGRVVHATRNRIFEV